MNILKRYKEQHAARSILKVSRALLCTGLLCAAGSVFGQQINPPGASGSFPAISADGRSIAYISYPRGADKYDTMLGVSLYNRDTLTTTNIARDALLLSGVDISADGQRVSYIDHSGRATAMVKDVGTGDLFTVSVNDAGEAGNASSVVASISNDDRYVAFQSFADNLVADDTNEVGDIFVHDLQERTTQRVSVNSAGEQSDRLNHFPVISGNGRYVIFGTLAKLVEDDPNPQSDVYVHDLETGETSLASYRPEGVTDWGNSFDPLSVTMAGTLPFLQKIIFLTQACHCSRFISGTQSIKPPRWLIRATMVKKYWE